VLAQLCGTSLWFSANSAADDLRRLWGLTAGDLGWLTNAVQAGQGIDADPLPFQASVNREKKHTAATAVVRQLVAAGNRDWLVETTPFERHARFDEPSEPTRDPPCDPRRRDERQRDDLDK